MAWIDIAPPARGGRNVGNGPRVTIGRRIHKSGAASLVLGISGALLTELGWPQVGTLRVQQDPDAGLLRLSTGGLVKTRGTGPKATGASLSFGWTQSTETKRAEVSSHKIEDGALIVTLPSWAAPQRAGIAGAQAARDAALAKLGTPPSTPRAPYVPISNRVPDPAAQGGRRG